MKKARLIIKKTLGFSLVEVMLASSIFGLLITAFVGAYLYGQQATALSGNRFRAALLVDEGVEAVRNIRDADIPLVEGTFGLTSTNGKWEFFDTSDVHGIFTRSITLASENENATLVTATVTWQQNTQRTGNVTLETRLTNWSAGSDAPASCNTYAISQGYSSGTCRQNTNQCKKYSEVHVSNGDNYCTEGPSADTCCAGL